MPEMQPLEPVDLRVAWPNEGESLVLLERTDAVSLTSAEAELEAARRWMADNLLSLRAALQPHLDRLAPTADVSGAAAAAPRQESAP